MSIVDDQQASFFEAFWKIYPRRVGKGAARKAMQAALKKATMEQVAIGLTNSVFHWRDTGLNIKYIPYPATWLNQERWEDEYPHSAELTASPSQQALRRVMMARGTNPQPQLESET